ncbi:MAG: hypothetical protein EXR77_00675 [Myxococcales bacterium]|nr:hypothetical protein [Myxococcales bacterium]
MATTVNFGDHLPARPRAMPSEDLAERTAAALWARLQLVRSRWRSVTAIEAVLLGLVAGTAILAVSLAVATAVDRSRAAFALVWLFAGVPAIATMLAMLIHRHRQQRQFARWAHVRAIRHRPTTDGELLRTGIELAEQVRTAGTSAVGSAWMVAATLAQADQQVVGLDVDVAAIGHRCKRYAAWLAVMVALFVVVRVQAPTTFAAWFADNLPPAIAVREMGTLVGDVRIRVEPPAYAARATVPRDEESGEVAALRGSRVTVSAAALPEFVVDSVELQTGANTSARSERQPVATLEGLGQVWQVTLLEVTRYRFTGRDKVGNPVREAGWRHLRTVADQPPRVSLSQPTGEVEVRPGQTLQLVWQVDDDIGLLQIELAVARPSGGLDRRPVTVVHGSLMQDVREALPVDSLQLRPGEVAQIQLEASDTNPFDGARKGVSDKLRVRMFSAERHHARVLDQLRQLADLWALRLADRLERDPSQQKTDLSAARKNRSLLATAEERALDELKVVRLLLAEDAQAKTRSLADLEAIERSLVDTLGDEARALQRTAAVGGELAGEPPNEAGFGESRELYAVQRHHALVIAQQEGGVAALADLVGDELEAMLARDAKSLQQASQQLLSTLEKLAEKDSKPLVAESERLLDHIEQQLERLAATASETAKLVPFEHLNARALQASSTQRDLHDQRSALADVRKLLREGKVREAMQRLRQIHDQMASTSGATGQRTAEDLALEGLVRELRRGVGRAQDAQGRLRDDLRLPAEEQAHAQEEYFRKMRDTALPQVADIVREVRDSIRPNRLGSTAARRQAGLGDVRQALDAAQEAIVRGQVDTALQRIAEAQDGMGAVKRALQDEEDLHEMAKAAADNRRLDGAYDKLTRAAQKLREALPEPEELLRPGGQGKLEGLANQQARVRLAMERLRKKLTEAGDAQPALQRQVGERLDHAGETMRHAEESLRRSDAAKAFAQTAEALEALDRAGDMLQQSGQGQAGKSQQGQSVGMEAGKTEVELGNGGANAEAEFYRQELLRAMHSKTPAGFRERLERYYKAIGR